MAEIEKSEAAKREEEVLAFWKENQIFEKTLEKEAPNGEFVFYDGPPFATGLPHSGSLLSSVSKDLIPRYKTMRGFRVRRRWGWDTHGLPIESLVEKKLGLKSKKDIVELGIETFNEAARAMVLEYVHDWKRYVERVGRFVDFDNSYKTMDNTFIESVWWGLKKIHEKGNLYEGRKVLMYCPHCETPLAKAEIAMDNTYKDVTEEAVTIRFKVKDPARHHLPENTSLLAWTTTPWTLPGNVALAVGADIEYVLVQNEGEHVILAKELHDGSNIVSEMKGSQLVGIEYEPLYVIARVLRYPGKKWEVVSADFVTTTDGTGIVHTAVIYGEDDYVLGLREELPMVPLLNPNGTYNEDAPDFIQGKYIKKAEVEIKADLEERALLFAKAPNTHSYPHCYRCGTALIYNAVSSWFINIQAIKEKMLQENESINWTPAHIKHGRFQHILEGAPDWTISRNRFWASPLPIWKDELGTVTVIGSLDELKKHTKKSGNTYFVMRHGEAENTVTRTLDSNPDRHPLTQKGREEAQQGAQRITVQGSVRIFASPVLRTKETAEIVAASLGISDADITYDNRLREFNFGEFEGRSLDDFLAWRAENPHQFDHTPKGGESYQDAKTRFGEFLYEVEEKYRNETIVIVTHGVGLETLSTVALGLDVQKSHEWLLKSSFAPGEVIALDFIPLPHNAKYELDFHLPYIDRIALVDKNEKPLTRIPEVVDCWVESGSMPFAEYHYPFENKEQFEKRSPGDFVSEYIGQTRAWFYYMHVVSNQLFGHAAFRNVTVTGNINAKDGAKFSKSKKNFTDPYVLFDQYGADAFRYYLMASVVMQAEDVQFRDEEVKEVHNRVVAMLRNVASFLAMYKDEIHLDATASEYLLDRWILARLDEVIRSTTESLDRYDVVRAVRPFKEFIEDLSTWYVRRSRDRVKGSDVEDRKAALQTLHTVLITFSKLIAPVMPFVADELFRSLRKESDPISVHLVEWPEPVGIEDAALVEDMKRVREFASEGLMLRQKADIKVRQPLATLHITGELSPALAAILADEVNVKEVREGAEAVSLDIELTPALIAEGDVRIFSRALAEARKEMDLLPKDQVRVTVDSAAKVLLSDVTIPGVREFVFSDTAADRSVELSTGRVTFSIDAS